ncbi:leucine-rich_repeat-containing protein [Hexamita inflata]|uniref:Leucine-rich_repeat-containing protein n=1 Tax=Hexamita inflata TaxID=28002 RepID=A0ABP1H9A5_9EUKA
MNKQEKHDKCALEMYEKQVLKGSLNIGKSEIVQNLQFVDKLPVSYLIVHHSSVICFDRTPTKLTTLELTESPKISFQGFEQMTQLTNLSLESNKLCKVNFICKLLRLTHLNISNNEIEDLNPLKQLLELIKINASRNKIYDISPLQKLVYIQVLRLYSNKIVDVGPLKHLCQLQALYLQQNQIVTIKPLQYLSRIVEYNVNNNFIQDLSFLQINLNTFYYQDEVEQIQDKPSKQLQFLSNKITSVYLQYDKLEKEENFTKITKLRFIKIQNKISQILTKSIKSHLYWQQQVVSLFLMTDDEPDQ